MFTLQVVAVIMMSFIQHSEVQDCRCCSPGFRQFDFWLGEWTVYNPDGTVAGTNTIDLIQDKCVIRENWISSTPGFSGTSYNYFSKSDSTWTQIWVDNQGGSLNLTGGIASGQMVLEGATTDSSGNTVINRITWTPDQDGSVRQLWETKADNQEWKTSFDGTYKRN